MNIAEVHVIILAGGHGSRLWPLCRHDHPKSLLDLGSGETLIEATLRRALMITTSDRVHLVTGADHQESITTIGAAFGITSIIVEPIYKDTAPALCLAAMLIHQEHPDALIVSTPFDHLISGESSQWVDTLTQAVIDAQSGDLICVGVRPRSPDTTLGYIHAPDPSSPSTPHRARLFKEKPDRATAEHYLRTGEHFWNSAIMACRSEAFLQHVRAFAPSVIAAVEAALDQYGQPEAESWSRIQAVAIDHVVLEPAAAAGVVQVVPASFDWADMGTWDALATRAPALFAPENVVTVDGTAPAVFAHSDAPSTRYAILGIDDLIIVNTGDVLVITNRAHACDMKRLVATIFERGWGDLL
ncbi:sugar phosphate nucleotidyltransferase [Lentzea sp. NPDC102401]|uniref:sugar phosphate nucleotidyltransferase n=1 Tax=Lentzea sp. NPDC102401 TaxID=3364128 RepID=UPI00382948A1